MRIEKYQDAFDLINIDYNKKAQYVINQLEQEGYKEKNICYAIWKSQDKILKFKDDSRLWSILQNEIRKIAYKNK